MNYSRQIGKYTIKYRTPEENIQVPNTFTAISVHRGEHLVLSEGDIAPPFYNHLPINQIDETLFLKSMENLDKPDYDEKSYDAEIDLYKHLIFL